MDSINIFGKEIPTYGLLGTLGVVLGIVYLLWSCRKDKKLLEDSIYIYIWACIAAMVGAKLLYLVIEAKNIVALMKMYPSQIVQIILAYLSGGFVFYGGLFGALLGVLLASRYFGLSFMKQLNIFAPIIPLVHGFGRIGCHLVGCCYGIEYSGFLHIIYENSTHAPNGIWLFPVQLVEASINFALFIVLAVMAAKKLGKGRLIYVYLLVYSVARFILEFFRGDGYRGRLLGVSTSQLISIAIWIYLLSVFVIGLRKNSDTCIHNTDN